MMTDLKQGLQKIADAVNQMVVAIDNMAQTEQADIAPGVTYSIGQTFTMVDGKHDGEDYMLVNTMTKDDGAEVVALVNMSSGLRRHNRGVVKDIRAITEAELTVIKGKGEFELMD